MGFTKAELALCRGATVPDLAGPGMRLAFVGINPGLWTAMTGIHFAHPSNRFYPALLAAGIVDRLVDVSPTRPSVPVPALHEPAGSAVRRYVRFEGFVPELADGGVRGGMSDEDRGHLIERGIGITNLVPMATARAAEVTPAEMAGGRTRVEAFVSAHQPRVVAVAGVTAYRVAFGDPRARLGRQERTVAGAALWVVPNPSGLNAHETVASLAARFREPAMEAGVVG